ncbi:MAG: PIN-like domain-containing protein [Synechococcus sp.]
MKDKFHGHYTPSDDEFASIWSDAIVVVDANVMLNLYTYSSATANEVIELLAEYSERLWLPHQVAAEYHKNRSGIILKEAKRYEEMRKILDRAGGELKAKRRHPYIDPNLATRFEEVVSEVQSALKVGEDKLLGLVSNDDICTRITTIFDGRVGDEWDEKALKELFIDGAQRYEDKVPPGYGDLKKPEPDRYGDLIIWKQLLSHAEKENKPAILVTDDQKRDWWAIVNDRRIGPRPELRQEFRRVTGNDMYLYSTESFVERAKELGKEVSDEAVQEIERAADERARRFAALRDAQVSVDAGLIKERILETLARPAFDVERILEALVRPSIDAERIREMLTRSPVDLELIRNALSQRSIEADELRKLVDREQEDPPEDEHKEDTEKE